MADSSSPSGLGTWIPWLLTTLLGSALVANSLNSDDGKADTTHHVIGSQQVFSQGTSHDERIRRIEEPLYEHFGISPDEETPASTPKPQLSAAEMSIIAANWATTARALGKQDCSSLLPVDDQQQLAAASTALASISVDLAKKQIASERPSTPAETKFKEQLLRRELEYMIMTVADPVDSAENYRFDMQLDALHKALSANPHDQWVFDGAYLPWQAFRDRTAQDAKLALDRREHWYQDEPGLLVYRSNSNPAVKKSVASEKDRLLLVFLVGELPTLGLQRDAFILAVDEIERLRSFGLADARVPDPFTVPVIGPVFTGAAHSLIEAIRLANEKYRSCYSFNVITGSATAIDPDLFHRRQIPFSSTVCHAEQERSAVLRFLQSDYHLKRRRKIAWLIESGTTFGANLRGQDFDTPNSTLTQIIYPYPMQISRVRKGFEQRLSDSKKAAGRDLNPVFSSSALPFDAPENTRDVPSPQTPQMTAPAVELVLTQIMDAIRRADIDYVGILATDIRDALFLATLVKLHSPSSQLIIMQSDLLHAHPDYSDVLSGALVVSSYPLFPEGLVWTASSTKTARSQVVLSNPSYFGIYNATLLQRLLRRAEVLRHLPGAPSDSDSLSPDLKSIQAEVRHKDRNPQHYSIIQGRIPPDENYLQGFNAPFAGSTDVACPGVWIQRIGVGGIYPVNHSIVGTDDLLAEYTLKVPVRVTAPPEQALSWLSEGIFWWGLCIAGLSLLTILTARSPAKEWRISIEWLAPFGSPAPSTGVRLVYLVAYGWLVLCLLSATTIAMAGHGGICFETNTRLMAYTQRNLFSGVSLLVPGALSCVAWFVLAFGWLRRTHMIEKYAGEYRRFCDLVRDHGSHLNQVAPSAIEICFPLRALNWRRSKAVILGVVEILAVIVLLWHAWRVNSNASGSIVLYWSMWVCLTLALLGWWVSLLGLTSLFEQLKFELDKQNDLMNSGAFGDILSKRPQVNRAVPETVNHLIDALKAGSGPGIGRLVLGPGPLAHDKSARALEMVQTDRLRNLVAVYRMLQVYFVHLRNHILALAIAACCLVLAVNSVPFTALPWLRLITTGGLVVLALQVCWFYIKLEQDEFLSFLLGSTPDKIEWNWPMLQRVGLLLVLAFATLLFQVMPESGGWLASILSPIVRLGK